MPPDQIRPPPFHGKHSPPRQEAYRVASVPDVGHVRRRNRERGPGHTASARRGHSTAGGATATETRAHTNTARRPNACLDFSPDSNRSRPSCRAAGTPHCADQHAHHHSAQRLAPTRNERNDPDTSPPPHRYRRRFHVKQARSWSPLNGQGRGPTAGPPPEASPPTNTASDPRSAKPLHRIQGGARARAPGRASQRTGGSTLRLAIAVSRETEAMRIATAAGPLRRWSRLPAIRVTAVRCNGQGLTEAFAHGSRFHVKTTACPNLVYPVHSQHIAEPTASGSRAAQAKTHAETGTHAETA